MRLGSAITTDNVNDATNQRTPILDRLPSPGIMEAVQGFNPRTHTPYVNFFDFFEGEALHIQVKNFNPRRTFLKGGATGMVSYSMTLGEVGPAISSSVAQPVLTGLMDFTTAWQSVNDFIASVAPDELFQGVADAGAFFVAKAAQLTTSIDAFRTGGEQVVALMSGGRPRPSAAIPQLVDNGPASFFGSVQQMIDDTDDLRIGLSPSGSGMGQPDLPTATGAIDWTQAQPTLLGGLDDYDRATEVNAMLDGLREQLVAGAYFGMSVEEFQAYIEGLGSGLGPALAGTLPHTVSITDTIEGIEEAYGVSWAAILAVNNLTPLEAVETGRVLEIPIARPTGPVGVTGLPVFGSHRGQSAWGQDVTLDLALAPNGDLALVRGPDVLEQGMVVLTEEFAAQILSELGTVPAAAEAPFVATRLAGLFRQDQRIASIASITVEDDPGGAGLQAAALLNAINGGTVLIGGST